MKNKQVLYQQSKRMLKHNTIYNDFISIFILRKGSFHIIKTNQLKIMTVKNIFIYFEEIQPI